MCDEKNLGKIGIFSRLYIKTLNSDVAQDDAEYMRINSGESRKGAHQFYRAQGCDSEKMQVRFLKELQ